MVGQIARQLHAPLLPVSLDTYIYTYVHIYTHIHTQMSILTVSVPSPYAVNTKNTDDGSAPILEVSRADYLRIYFSSSVMPYLLFKEVKLMV